jgi:hypothetical protein
MFKACQYAINDENVIVGLKVQVIVKATQSNLQKITWTKKLGKRR